MSHRSTWVFWIADGSVEKEGKGGCQMDQADSWVRENVIESRDEDNNRGKKKINKNKKHLTKDLPEMLFNVLVYTQLRKQTRSDLGIISRPLRFIEINFKQRKIT